MDRGKRFYIIKLCLREVRKEKREKRKKLYGIVRVIISKVFSYYSGILFLGCFGVYGYRSVCFVDIIL